MKFRSYLRGMETRCGKHLSLLHLLNSDPTYEAWKLGSRAYPPEYKHLNSDPTYEAWKHIS